MSRHREKIAARVRPTDLVMCNRRIIRPNEAIARSMEPDSFSFGYVDLRKSRLIGLWLSANRRSFYRRALEIRDNASAFNARVRFPLPSPQLLIRFSLSLSWCTTGMIMRIEPWAVYAGERGRPRERED